MLVDSGGRGRGMASRRAESFLVVIRIRVRDSRVLREGRRNFIRGRGRGRGGSAFFRGKERGGGVGERGRGRRRRGGKTGVVGVGAVFARVRRAEGGFHGVEEEKKSLLFHRD